MSKRLRKLKKIMIFGLECLLFVFIDFIYLLTYLIPKQKDKWLFGAGSSFGNEYRDNSKYFFEYIYKNKNKTQSTPNAIWITKSKKIVQIVRKAGYPCYYYLSLKGIWHTLSANKIFVTHGKHEINSLLINSQVKVINLWHGIPLKLIGDDDKLNAKTHPLYKFIEKYILFAYKEKIDLLPVSSEHIQKRFISALNLSKEKTPILGSPRDDSLISAAATTKKNNKGLKRILYAPTHRGASRTLTILPNNSECNKLNEFLKQNKIILDFRLHRFDKIHLKKLNLLDKYSQIRIDPYDNIEDSMINSDVLITDYSSCFYDYLLLDKPLIFHAPDLKRYMSLDDQFYEKNYDQFIPGPKTQSWDEVMSNLQNLIDKKDDYKIKRKDLKNKIFEFTDGKNCERILKFLQNRHH